MCRIPKEVCSPRTVTHLSDLVLQESDLLLLVSLDPLLLIPQALHLSNEGGESLLELTVLPREGLLHFLQGFTLLLVFVLPELLLGGYTLDLRLRFVLEVRLKVL